MSLGIGFTDKTSIVRLNLGALLVCELLSSSPRSSFGHEVRLLAAAHARQCASSSRPEPLAAKSLATDFGSFYRHNLLKFHVFNVAHHFFAKERVDLF